MSIFNIKRLYLLINSSVKQVSIFYSCKVNISFNHFSTKTITNKINIWKYNMMTSLDLSCSDCVHFTHRTIPLNYWSNLSYVHIMFVQLIRLRSYFLCCYDFNYATASWRFRELEIMSQFDIWWNVSFSFWIKWESPQIVIVLVAVYPHIYVYTLFSMVKSCDSGWSTHFLYHVIISFKWKIADYTFQRVFRLYIKSTPHILHQKAFYLYFDINDQDIKCLEKRHHSNFFSSK